MKLILPQVFAVLLLGVSSGAGASVQGQSEVEALFELMGMPQAARAAADHFGLVPNAKMVPAEDLACLQSIMSVGAVEAEFRKNFRVVFSDPQQVSIVTTFANTSAGLKLMGSIREVAGTERNPVPPNFTESELETIGRFGASDVGQLLAAAPGTLVALNKQSISALGREAVRTCALKLHGIRR